MRVAREALIETEVRTPLVALTDPKVSMTPSSNRFVLTLDGICVLHPIESDMRNGQFFQQGAHHVRSIRPTWPNQRGV
jgi:hypothetical protein